MTCGDEIEQKRGEKQLDGNSPESEQHDCSVELEPDETGGFKVVERCICVSLSVQAAAWWADERSAGLDEPGSRREQVDSQDYPNEQGPLDGGARWGNVE